jgi:hypothetical protein
MYDRIGRFGRKEEGDGIFDVDDASVAVDVWHHFRTIFRKIANLKKPI